MEQDKITAPVESSTRQLAQRKTIWGREAFLELLVSEGVDHMFGNPGTTELPIMHALKDVPEMNYILGLQESIVVAMADGYARASGKLVACNVHVAPGLGNAMGTLFTAHYSGTPMIITAGQQEQGHGLTEPLLFGPLVRMAEPVVKWAVEVNRLEDLPRIVRRAAKVAMTPPTGPVFISLPGDILNAQATIDMSTPTRIETQTVPVQSVLEQMAERIIAAKNPVILAGHEMVTSDSFELARAFADALGAPVYQQTVPNGAHYPSEHGLYMGDLSRNQADVHQRLAPHDLLISLGADILRMSVYSETQALPDTTDVMHIGLNDWEMGKNFPSVMAVRADLSATLGALTPQLIEQGGAELAQLAKSRFDSVQNINWLANRKVRAAAAIEKAERVPIDPDWLMHELVASMPDNTLVVEEALVSSRSLLTYLPYRHRHSFFGNHSGGIGWAIAAAVGISLAKPEQRILAIIGDGSAMYSIQALWSAAHLKLPITFVIANNGGYRIIKERLKAFHGSEHYVAMDFDEPTIQFADLATSFGMDAQRAENATQLNAALQLAYAGSGPYLIEAMVERGP